MGCTDHCVLITDSTNEYISAMDPPSSSPTPSYHTKYVSNPPDQPISLGELDVECIGPGGVRSKIRVTGLQSLIPSQRAKLIYSGEGFDFSDPTSLPDLKLYWPEQKEPFIHYAIQKSQTIIGDSPSFTARWEENRIDLPASITGTTFTKVTSYVLSFPNFISKRQLLIDTADGRKYNSCCAELNSDGWTIIIASHQHTESHIKSLDAGSSYAITHSIVITRSDGAEFQSPESDVIIDDIYYYLSFCVGRRIGIGLEVGTEKNGKETPLRFGFKSSSRWSSSHKHHWWDAELGRIDLSSAFSGFCALRRHPIWKDHLPSIFYWYLEANQLDRGTIATDTGIVLAQMALEKIAWVFLVHDRKAFTEQDFDKIAASGKIRAAAAMLRLPLGIPPDISKAIVQNDHKIQDIPHLITEVRNDLVHPRKRQRVKINPYYVWNISQWYIELMILNLSGYNGLYNNRAMITKWRMAPTHVPWTVK